ncbi:site-specific DNA-methyltransferase [Streptococcus devriesei]|uniref:site-specific DNA-methyltransferase n=1 Tax=Streptococcus devriesei TaxID=231233 RepID=UPI000413181D|nr:site-specific DNA-methyltransferase [Streptococcus devriesei]
MLKDNMKENENIKSNSREIEILKSNFPQFFDKDGEFLMDRFKEMLEESDISLNKEGYELKFLGKSYARYLSSTKTETFIAPNKSENEKEENKDSKNLYIIGDNLDALKHLLGSYAGNIKCIYIDPPYNTGSDGFVYPDNFSFNVKELAETIGIEEEEAQRILDLAGKSSHSAWLTFMYPRLLLARELLSDDGVIFISIDDNEQANLKLMCDEVFGEENFIKDLVVNTAEGGGNAKYVINGHEIVYVYAKNISHFDNLKRPKDIRGKKVVINGELYWIQEDAIREEFGKYGNLHYEDIIEVKGLEYKNKIDEGIKNNEYILVPKSYGKNIIGKLRKVSEDFSKFHSILNIDSVSKHLTADGIRELEDIYETSKGKAPFDNPKPLNLIKKLVLATTFKGNNKEIVLDFFSGSATTAHAVMQLNAEDGGNRKYILVQIPEEIKEDKPAYKAGYRTIDEIGRERIKRAAKKIKEETRAEIDYGFKTYSLEQLEEDILTNLDYFDDNPKLILDDMVSVFDTENAKGKDAILSTYLALDGYGLSVNTEKYKLDKFVADKIDNSLYIIDQGLESSDVMELIRRIESLELDISRVVIYVNSISFNVHHELKKNLSSLRNNKHVELIERY